MLNLTEASSLDAQIHSLDRLRCESVSQTQSVDNIQTSHQRRERASERERAESVSIIWSRRRFARMMTGGRMKNARDDGGPVVPHGHNDFISGSQRALLLTGFQEMSHPVILTNILFISRGQ